MSFFKKIASKITDVAIDIGTKQAKKTVEKKLGSEAADQLESDFRTMIKTNPTAQVAIERVNNIGAAAIATSVVLGAGAVAGVGGGAAGAGVKAADAAGSKTSEVAVAPVNNTPVIPEPPKPVDVPPPSPKLPVPIEQVARATGLTSMSGLGADDDVPLYSQPLNAGGNVPVTPSAADNNIFDLIDKGIAKADKVLGSAGAIIKEGNDVINGRTSSRVIGASGGSGGSRNKTASFDIQSSSGMIMLFAVVLLLIAVFKRKPSYRRSSR